MSVDTNGVLTALNIATPVMEGHEHALRAYLRSLPQGDASPLARLGTVHFGRWSLIGCWPEHGQWTLWCSVNIEGTPEQFVDGVRRLVPGEAEAVWSHCVGWPGVEESAALERWLLGQRIPTEHFLALYPNATLADCKRALRLRRDFVQFAIRAQNQAPVEVAAKFRERFRLGS